MDKLLKADNLCTRLWLATKTREYQKRRAEIIYAYAGHRISQNLAAIGRTFLNIASPLRTEKDPKKVNYVEPPSNWMN